MEMPMSNVAEGGPESSRRCSLCGKGQHSVRKLVAGPHVYICDECVELCMVIARGDSASFYLRTPTEYRKLAADDVRAAEEAGMPADKALLAVGRTWLRLAEESEKEASQLLATASESAVRAEESKAAQAQQSQTAPQAERSEPAAQAEETKAAPQTQAKQSQTTAQTGQSEIVAQADQREAAQILTSLGKLASQSEENRVSQSEDKPD
jgi:hypothetical protein